MSSATPRIVSLLPSATEIVCALGLEGSLVGVTHECDYPPAVIGKPQLTASRISHQTMTSAEVDHAVRSQLDGHGSIYDLDEAQLRALEPDLILTQELCEVCAVSYRAVEQATRMFSADVDVVSLEPNTIADILATIRTVGQLTGTDARAEALARLPPGWPELPAVREGNVWAVDATSYFSRPGPRIVDGAEILAHIIHPQRFGAPAEHLAIRVSPELMGV